MRRAWIRWRTASHFGSALSFFITRNYSPWYVSKETIQNFGKTMKYFTLCMFFSSYIYNSSIEMNKHEYSMVITWSDDGFISIFWIITSFFFSFSRSIISLYAFRRKIRSTLWTAHHNAWWYDSVLYFLLDFWPIFFSFLPFAHTQFFILDNESDLKKVQLVINFSLNHLDYIYFDTIFIFWCKVHTSFW